MQCKSRQIRLHRPWLNLPHHLLPAVLGISSLLLTSSALAEQKLSDSFNRPDSTVLGEGWVAVPNQQSCIQLDEEAQEFRKTPEGSKEPQKGHELFSEISREIEETTAKSRPPRTAAPGDPTAEISHGMLYLHYGNGQSPVMVQRLIDKKVMQLSLDLTPLYAMAGEDDRAWMAIKILYLDNTNHPLGEIRYYHYHSVLEENINSDTIHSILVKEPFDGELRHVVIDAGTILKQKLPGIDHRKIAQSRISLEISSTLCDATVEGYFDNVVAVLADGAGLLRFTKEELNQLVQSGIKLHAKDPVNFQKVWIDGLIKTFGREKIVAWLSEIPLEARTNPAKLLTMIKTTYGFSGQQAFDTAFVIQYLLQAM
ncbi:MAG: hypothetical protein HQL84_18720 [Magnetococcales bacterium]|nr:hypothetical protein [Magnetococcales bacterium]MBF0152055.1 hypothetical protein [Magnetococcales bacterium]MBF0630683.1 hypothetical protein [Magnetococcales bacterium]